MKLLPFLTRSALVLIASCGMLQAADEPSYYVKGSLFNPQGDLQHLTKTPGFSYGGEVGWVLPTQGTGLTFTTHAGYFLIRGLGDGHHDTRAGAVGLDLGYALPMNLTFKTGPVLHTWDIADPADPAGGSKGENAWKLGWRLGLDYKITPSWTANMTYAFSEWTPGINPSYLSLGAAYRF